MVKIPNLLRSIPRRYRHYPCLIIFICLLIFLISSRQSQVETLTDAVDASNKFDLVDDDDMIFVCPIDIQFNILNRRHLVVIVGPKLVSYVWKNFRALLCTGVDVYVILDEVFNINSSLRADGFETRTNRSQHSYTHRFLYVSNDELAKYGVSYMMKYPTVQYAAWDRAIVWLYYRNYLTTAWLISSSVQWLHVHNMTHLFDLYIHDKTDILCADIVQPSATFWQNWPKQESDIFPRSSWLGTFSPLVRWSRRLLLHHYQYMQLIHKKRLQYDINTDFRFQEYLMGTIANIEKLSIGLYNQKNPFLHISLGYFNETAILSLLRNGKHIIHPIPYESILTSHTVSDIRKLVKANNI